MADYDIKKLDVKKLTCQEIQKVAYYDIPKVRPFGPFTLTYTDRRTGVCEEVSLAEYFESQRADFQEDHRRLVESSPKIPKRKWNEKTWEWEEAE
jgi:hypothetical protein